MLLLAAALLGGSLATRAELTDQQVLDYLLEAQASGKSQQQVGRELVRQGVTQQQLKRVKALYEQQVAAESPSMASAQRRTSTQPASGVLRETASAEKEQNPVTVQETVVMTELPVNQGPTVYGREVFNNPSLTFEPNVNMATPQDYVLGPGDEVVINIWGNNEDTIRDFITPEGSIMVSNIGPVHLSGLTVKQANNQLKNIFASKYADIADEGSDISLVLGNLRTIQVDIMGEVTTPGTYRLSPFSTLFNALYNAGGTTSTGTLRNIEVYRNGRRVGQADVYDYLFKGKTSNDIKLQEGDVIIVSPYETLVTFENGVKRPMTYELKNGETIADALYYAGGLLGDAYGDRMNITRTTGEGLTVLTVESDKYGSTPLRDGDLIDIGTALNRFNNRITISGSVFRPGDYALDQAVKTLSDLVKKADGLMEDAFTGRVLLYREAPDLSTYIESVDLGAILNGTAPDVSLKPNDRVVVPSVLSLSPKGDVQIMGAVAAPGRFSYADGMTVEDLIVRAGGLLEGASNAKIDISRRIVDKNATEAQSQIAETYTVNISDGLVTGGNKEFKLEPNDIVDVRFSPTFMTQKRVSVTGEVVFPGDYSLNNRAERLSDLVKRAGGVSKYAYLKGASLTRRFTEDESVARKEVMKLINKSEGSDSISEKLVITSDYYPVGINLEDALANPGGYEDLVLQPGDHLTIPELNNTVKISGEVLFPNSVIFSPGKNWKYYIEQAGGFGNSANKGKAFVVYMNGQVARASKAKIEPGCHLIVPSKEKRDSSAELQKWLAIGTSAASLGTMAASIVNLVR